MLLRMHQGTWKKWDLLRANHQRMVQGCKESKLSLITGHSMNKGFATDISTTTSRRIILVFLLEICFGEQPKQHIKKSMIGWWVNLKKFMLMHTIGCKLIQQQYGLDTCSGTLVWQILYWITCVGVSIAKYWNLDLSL